MYTVIRSTYPDIVDRDKQADTDSFSRKPAEESAMPLWSNENWRARIGSCWCALGRTFNTRFTRCRGKSQRDLSTHQAATMVIMMILFIAANMGLYVTRERHKNLICVLFGNTIMELHLFRFGLLLSLFVPVLKFVVQMVCGRLPRKLKMSLKNFFIDLNDSLWFIGSVIRTFIVSPVLFVVNFTTGNISNVLGKLSYHLTKLVGDRLSNGILMRSLVVAIIVTIQLLVSVVVARAIVYLLLLISGDVERNPGPRNIDYSVIKVLLVKVETTAVQSSLLLRCGDIESNPGPLTSEGAVNQDVERSIDKVVKSGQINDPDRMFNDLSFVIHDKYMEIGVDLGLGYDYLHNQLETSGVSVTETGNKKAMKMLKLWQRFIDTNHFTYSVLATALEKYGFHDAARNFCYAEATLQSIPQQCVETREAPTVNSGNNPLLAVANVVPIVNMPHGQHNNQSPHPSSSFMDRSPAHMHMDNQTSFSPHLNNQGATPIQSLPSNWTLYPEQNLDRGFYSVPDPKRRKLDPSQPPLGQVPLTTHDLQHIDRWQRMLVDSYLTQEHSTDAWPPLKIVKFIKLALVKEDEQAYHLGLQTVQKDIDAVYGQKSNTSYENLFQNIDNGSLVLFEGRPGSGKTTLMVRASCDWGRENIFKFKLVILVRLRHLNKSRDVYLHDLLRVACSAFTPEDVQGLSSYIEGRLGEDVVFLLDGFDEYALGASDDNYISRLILKMVYSRSIVILSSRPAATQRFRQNATLWIEVVGFMKEQVLQYINCYFEQNKEKSSSLIKHLEEHENLMNLCYLPLHCAMLVFLYNIGDALPETETHFYRDFTMSLLFRGIRKDTNLKPLRKLKSFDGLPDKKKEAFNKIGKLAFEATVARRQVFEESEVQDICFNDSSDNEESLGLVVVDRYFAKTGINETYTFLHLTLQEFLAAVFVSRLSESEQISAMATKFVEQHLFVTSHFLFGMLDYSKKSTKNLFKRMLDATNNALLHHIQCAYESHSASACTDVVNFHKKSLKFQSINNSSYYVFYISYILKTGEYDDIELSFSKCNFNVSEFSLLQGIGDRQLSLTIRLTNCDISNSGLDKSLKHWPNLVKLELYHCYCHVTSVPEVLEEGLQHMTKAHQTTDQTLEITLHNCDFNKEAAVGLLQAVGDRRLSLTIKYKNKDIDNAQPLLDALCIVTLPGLIELNVFYYFEDAYGDDVHLTMKPNNLKHSTKLQILDLCRLDISNSGLEKALKHWPNLVKLNLDYCHIDASTAVVLAESLQHTSKLQTLGLSDNSIGDTGLHALSLPIKNYCKELKELWIWKIQLTDRSITCLTEWIKVLNNLEQLILGRNHFSKGGVKQIEEAVSERNTRKGVAKLKLDINYQEPYMRIVII